MEFKCHRTCTSSLTSSKHPAAQRGRGHQRLALKPAVNVGLASSKRQHGSATNVVTLGPERGCTEPFVLAPLQPYCPCDFNTVVAGEFKHRETERRKPGLTQSPFVLEAGWFAFLALSG